MINISRIYALAEAHAEFSLDFIDAEGHRQHIDRCAMTSFHSNGTTMNVRCIPSGQIRKINRYSITAFNGEETVI